MLPPTKHIRQRSDGLSLVEILVTVAVIAVLLAITLPALRSARVSGGRTTMLSNLRGIGAVFEIYTQVYDGCYPFHARGEWYVLQPPGEPGGTSLDDDPWGLRGKWASAFHAVAPWREHYRSWINSGRVVNDSAPWLSDVATGGSASGEVSYHYACSFQARPESWKPDAPPFTPEMLDRVLVPTRAPEVASPSQKALCFDIDRAYLLRDARADDPRGVLLTDGSASLRADADSAKPVQNRVNDRPPWRYHDTPNGVRGRDFQ